MSSTSNQIGHQETVSATALHAGSRSTTPKKLPKSLVEFWARPEEASSNAIRRTSSITTKSSSSSSKYRMITMQSNAAPKNTVKKPQAVDGSQGLDCEEPIPSSPPRQLQESVCNSHDDTKEEHAELSIDNAQDAETSKPSFVHVEEESFAISDHCSFEQSPTTGDDKNSKKESFDDSQQHASWVWDGETQELLHVGADQWNKTSTDGRSGDASSNHGSLDRQSSQNSTDGEQPIPENVIANVVHAATAAILNDSTQLSAYDASSCSNSYRSTTFHSVHETLQEDSAQTQDDEPDPAQPLKPAVDLNASEYSANVMANIVNAANAAVQENVGDPPAVGAQVDAKSLKAHLGEIPMRSNRQEECAEEGKRTALKMPPRTSPPSRRIMNASPLPPSSPDAAVRRTFSQGDSKPRSPERDSFQDDTTSASSTYRDSIQDDNFDRLFGAIFGFMNPSDDQSEISGDTFSTGLPRSIDQSPQQACLLSEEKPLLADGKKKLLNIQSWWTDESGQTTPITIACASEQSGVGRSETDKTAPWLEAIQSSLFPKPSQNEAFQVKGWEPKSYFDEASFDAIEEIALALKQKQGSATATKGSATATKSTQDALSKEFLSRFEKVREEMGRFQNSTDDGIEVTIGDSRLDTVEVEQPTHTVAAFQENENKEESVAVDAFSSPIEEELERAVLTRSMHGTPSIEVPISAELDSVKCFDSSPPEFTTENEQGFITPESSMLMLDDGNSLSPILPTTESPIAEHTTSQWFGENQAAVESKTPKSGPAQTSEEQASIEQQLKDLYEVVKRDRKTQRNGSHTSSRNSDFFQTPPLKKNGVLDLDHLTPATADETDVSPPSERSPRRLRAPISKSRRKLPKISVTTLSGNKPTVEKILPAEHESAPSIFFACALSDRLGANGVNVDSALTGGPQPSDFGSQNDEKRVKSNPIPRRFDQDLKFDTTEQGTRMVHESPSPNRLQLLTKKKSQYSIVDDCSQPSAKNRPQRSIKDFLTGPKQAKRSDGEEPSQSEVSLGSISVSSGRETMSEDPGQKRRKRIKAKFVRQLSMSWLKRSNKPKMRRGSILDEESDFNDTTNDSSFHSFEVKNLKEPFGSPFDIPNIEEAVPYPGSVDSNNEFSLSYSCGSPESSFQWTAPTKRMARKMQVGSTWQPHLQGLDDTWDEMDGDTENTTFPTRQRRKKQSRGFKRHSSLRSIQWRGTSTDDEKGNSSSPSPIRRSLFSRSSSLPNIGEDPILQPKSTFQATTMKEIAWDPPSPQHQMSVNHSEENELFLIPPAATWEEFNGFSRDFWQPQEI